MLRRSGSAPSMPRRPRASASHCAVASTASTRTPNAGASVSRIKTTAQPAKALSSRAVGLGAWLVPPMGSGRSEFHENGPASITAWLPSACALTVGLLLAFSGCSSKCRTVWRIVSGCTCVLLPLAAYPPHDASRPGSTHPRKVYSPKCLEKLFDNSKQLLVLGSNELAKAPEKRCHFVVFTATDSRSEGLQRFIKQFLEGKFCEVELPLYGVLRSSPPYRTLEGRSVRRPAFRNNSTLIPTTHRMISVGKMMVAVLVNPMDSPVYACTRPTGTEPTPAITTTHPSHPGYSPLQATASPRRMKVTPAKRMLNRAARAKLMASSARITRRAAAASSGGAASHASARCLAATPSTITRITPTVTPATAATDPNRVRAPGTPSSIEREIATRPPSMRINPTTITR